MKLPVFTTDAIKSSENKIFRIWLPKIVGWSILITMYIILLPLTAVAELILQGRGIRPFSILIEFGQEFSYRKGYWNDTPDIYDNCDQVLRR
jgi:hypothetical protein